MATNGHGPGPAGQESVNPDIITLSRYLTEEQSKHPTATGDFTYVLLPAESVEVDCLRFGRQTILIDYPFCLVFFCILCSSLSNRLLTLSVVHH